MMQIKTEAIVGAVFGGVLIIYLITAVWNDTTTELDSVNETAKGGALIKLIPLFLAFGVLIGVYKMFVAK
jgi:hypothetical protein